MASKIDIASNALILIGENPIQSFEDPSAGGTAAANLYDNAYCSMLAYHPWSFALREQVLNRLTLTPDSYTGYQYAYQKPTDLIRFWSMMPNHEYDLVREYVYSNQSRILARYIFKVNESQLPPHFIEAIQYKLASDFAMIITEDENKSALMMKKYKDALSIAMAIDSQGRPQKPMQRNPFNVGASR